MGKLNKHNLIMTHSFPTNSIILAGLIEFLKDHFKVYFIDLPGFTKAVPPLKEISLQAYADYMSNEIEKLNLDKYILGGLSFSHCLISQINLDEKCRAIISMEPFVDQRSLLINKRKLLLYKSFIKLVKEFKLYDKLWKKEYLCLILKYKDKKILDIVINEFDPRTIIYTADCLFKFNGPKWHKKPYALVANKNDKRVSYYENLRLFRENVNDLLAVDTTVDHFPDFMTKEYFQTNISKEAVEKMMGWLDKHY
jgi:hypothetical protein